MSIPSPSGPPRVGFEREMREVYEHLAHDRQAASQDIEERPFKTMKDLFMFAACRGYQLGERRSLKAPREAPIHWDVFSEQVDLPILKALAIVATGDVSVLARSDEIASIAEEYANAGIRDLQYMLLNQQGEPLWNLVNLIRDESH